MPPGVKRRLEIDALHRGMFQAEANNPADFMFVHPVLDGGNQDYRAADLRKTVQRAQFLRQNIRFAPDDAIRLALKTIELEIDVRLNFRELFEKAVIGGDSFAIGIQHHVGDAAILRGFHHRDDLRVYRRLASGKLNHLGISFGRNQMIENLFHFFQREAEAGARFGKT